MLHSASPLVALVAAWVLVALAMPATIARLRRNGLVQVIRREGPAAHLAKEGTPMAAGMVFVAAGCLAAWALAPRSAALLVVLGVTLGHALLGFADDYLKVVRRRPEGLIARYKLVGQVALALVLAGYAILGDPAALQLRVPASAARLALGPGTFVLLTLVAVLGASNGTNFTDGADGLLASTGAAALGVLGVMAWVAGERGLATFALALVGGLFGFLLWNWHPARVFMGDTGSMALGAAFAGIGILGGWTLYLPVIGLLFVLEVLSVIVQVGHYRLTGRRLLRMAPLHHHLELSGWREGKLVPRLLVFALVCGAAGLALYLW